MNISIGKIQKALSPNPFVLVTSTREDGVTNAMALSWWCYASNNPPTLLICTSNKGYTGECIRRTKQFALCFPTEKIQDGAFRCGTCSGRNTDKLAAFGLETEAASVIDTKLLKHCKAALECRLVNEIPAGDHTIYVGQIVETHLEENCDALYALSGYAQLGTVKADCGEQSLHE